MKMKQIWASLALVAALAGCQEAAQYEPAIYITEAQREPAKIVTITQAGEKATFSVSASQIVGHETHATLQVCPELLEAYNSRYGRTCVLLDEKLYDFEKQEVTIKAGTSVSDEAEIVVKEALQPGTFYCLPMRIVQTDGSMSILDASSTLYLVFRAPVHGKGVYIGQYETVNKGPVLEQADELRAAMEEYRTANGGDTLVLLVTDIIEEGSQVFVCGDPAVVEKGLGIEAREEGVWMPGVLSRKKQVAAPLIAAAE